MDIELFLAQDATGTAIDLRVENGGLAVDHEIKTAVLRSLFTDRRAEDDDVLPDPLGGARGWWGDAFLPSPMGSRLWLLGREKILPETLTRARDYAREALQWLVEAGVARSIEVDVLRVELDRLALVVAINRNGSPPARYRFELAWAGANQLRE